MRKTFFHTVLAFILCLGLLFSISSNVFASTSQQYKGDVVYIAPLGGGDLGPIGEMAEHKDDIVYIAPLGGGDLGPIREMADE